MGSLMELVHKFDCKKISRSAISLAPRVLAAAIASSFFLSLPASADCTHLYSPHPTLQASNASAHLFGELELGQATSTHSEGIKSFIRKVRSTLSVDPEFTAAGTPLYTDLDSFSSNFDGKKSRFFILQNSRLEIVATVSFVDKGNGVAELKRFYLDPSLQGKGIGKKLITMAIESATLSGYHQLTLQTDAAMTAAIGLYLKVGFTESPTESQASTRARYFSKDL